MKLGVTFPEKWKQISQKENTAISDILYGVAVEDLLLRIENSSFSEFLWLTSEQAVGLEAYKKKTKDRIAFLYVESGKKNYLSHAVAGQAFDLDVLMLLLEELFTQENADSKWTYAAQECENGYYFSLSYTYEQMQVPVSVYIRTASVQTKKSKRKKFPLLVEEGKTCSYMCYSKESILAEALFEIMRKLELISDMEAYSEANAILKEYSISGRYILEEFIVMGEKEPKVVSMKRLEQISSYKDYAYMKKRWQQYERSHKLEKEDWEGVLTRILTFLAPVWKALCEDEIFFDDWMPELERFLS